MLFRISDDPSEWSYGERRASGFRVGLDRSESSCAEQIEERDPNAWLCEERRQSGCRGECNPCVLSYEERTLAATD